MGSGKGKSRRIKASASNTTATAAASTARDAAVQTTILLEVKDENFINGNEGVTTVKICHQLGFNLDEPNINFIEENLLVLEQQGRARKELKNHWNEPRERKKINELGLEGYGNELRWFVVGGELPHETDDETRSRIDFFFDFLREKWTRERE